MNNWEYKLFRLNLYMVQISLQNSAGNPPLGTNGSKSTLVT